MYSPLVVGGSNTHNYNMPTQKKQNNSGVREGVHITIREEVMQGTAGGPSTVVAGLTTPAGISYVANGFALCPFGLSSVTVAGNVYTAGSSNVDFPHLRKLYNICNDFRYYRVLSGRLIFIPNIGTNTPGNLVLSSSRDVMDLTNTPQAAFAAGPSYKLFTLGGGKELSIPLDIDSSWKKVSSLLTVPANTQPFAGSATSNSFAVCNTVNDLCFTSVAAQIISGVPSTNYGSLAVQYVLECKGPIDASQNV